MVDRFGVRVTQVGFGVWDAAVNGWHGRNDLTQQDANQLAAKMNATAPMTGTRIRPGNDPKSRPVDPPKRVLIRLGDMWVPGELYWWVWENGSWQGQVSVDTQAKRMWIHQRDLDDPDQAVAGTSGGS